SLPRLPGRMNIYRPAGREKAERRTRYVLSRLKELGWITDVEHDRAVEQIGALRLATRDVRPPNCLHAILAIEKEIKAHRLAPPGASSPIVRTTLNLDIQDTV